MDSEHALASQDVLCKAETSLVDEYRAALVRWQEASVEKNRPLTDELVAIHARTVENAQAILAGSG